jgi:hypothetical protein
MSTTEQIYIGNTKSFITEKEVTGEQVLIRNEAYYKISNVETMRPFFMSIVSNSNHWMFISSNGGVTAGRKDSNTALFPYYTDDKVTESEDVSGTKTLLRVQKNDKVYLWEPFSTLYKGVYNTSRNLFKNKFGNKVIFEEINHDLDLTFIFEWNSSNLYGFVKKSKLINHSKETTTVTVLDGLQNILPYGVGEDLQKASSNLVDAYKRSELVAETGLGIYALSAIIVDKAEPSEALKSNIVWSIGIENPTYLLSSLQVSNFRKGFELTQESDIKAEKGAYFVNFKQELKPNEEKKWSLIANVNQSVSNIIELNEQIKHTQDFTSVIQNDIDKGTNHLIQLVGAADGIQLTADKLRNSRHFSNTMFNIMRGGIFDDNYNIEKSDFVKYIANANKKVYKKKSTLLNDLPETFSVNHIKEIASNDDDKNFKRLCIEYLPLKFSRRHGDPSRPWNKFSINTRSEVDGSKILDYEGNWRDIFQNWEALAHSYPEFIEGMIHKFLNATTFDGYNPYRVTKGGFDFTGITNSGLDFYNMVLIMDNGTQGDGSANYTIFLDDITTSPSLDFEPKFTLSSFDGGDISVVANPHATGNSSSMVAQMVKNAGQPWAGSKITVPTPFSFVGQSKVKVKVWSPRAGLNLLMKFEDDVPWPNVSASADVIATTTVANGWEELTFDFTGISTSIDFYNIVLIMDNGTQGDGSANYTIFLDDITQF